MMCSDDMYITEMRTITLDGEEIEYEVSSGNVFADLGLPDADELFAAGQSLIQIQRRIEGAGWTRREAAVRAGVTRCALSDLLRGRLAGFTTERLLRIAARLGCDTDATPTHDSSARLRQT